MFGRPAAGAGGGGAGGVKASAPPRIRPTPPTRARAPRAIFSIAFSLVLRRKRHRAHVHDGGDLLLRRLQRQRVASRLVDLHSPNFARLEVLEPARVLDGEFQNLIADGGLDL